MNALLILLPVSLILVGAALWSFFWAVDNAQFDDLEGPGMIPLSDLSPMADATGESSAGKDE
jgi:cbb3-type cytochrome oxidase maturation protein